MDDITPQTHKPTNIGAYHVKHKSNIKDSANVYTSSEL